MTYCEFLVDKFALGRYGPLSANESIANDEDLMQIQESSPTFHLMESVFSPDMPRPRVGREDPTHNAETLVVNDRCTR